MEYCQNQIHPAQSNARSDQNMSGNVCNATMNGELSLNSNQAYNTGQGIPMENQWSTPSLGNQTPMALNTSSVNQAYPAHVNQFVPQFPYPANPPGQFMPPCDWMTPNTLLMPPPPPPPFPPYNHMMMPFTPSMGYPSYPFMSFGPSQSMFPFPQIKMEQGVDSTPGYYNMGPRYGQTGAMMDPTSGYYNMAPRYGQGWHEGSMYGPTQQHYNNYYQGYQGYPTGFQNSQGTQGHHPVAGTSNQGAQAHSTAATNSDSSGQSTEKSEQINVPTVENIVNTSNQIDSQGGSAVSESKTSSKCPKDTTPKSTLKCVPEESSGGSNRYKCSPTPQRQTYEETSASVSLSSESDLNSNSSRDSSKPINWLSKLESTRLKMRFSPCEKADLACDSCSQWKYKCSVGSSKTPSSDDDVVIVPGKIRSVQIRHILCEKCGAVNESEGVVQNREKSSLKRLPLHKCTTSKRSASNVKDTIAQINDKHSDLVNESPLSQKFLLFSKIGTKFETFEVINEESTNPVSTSPPKPGKEAHELTVYNLGTLAQLQTDCPGKASPLSDSQSPGNVPKISQAFDTSDEVKYDLSQPETSSFTDCSGSSGHQLTLTPDATRKITMKGIVSMHNKNKELASSNSSQVSNPLPPAKKIRICWSCQTQQSKGAWHGHKFRDNHFLCGECFEMHKKSNARREEVSAEDQKVKDKVVPTEKSVLAEKLPKKTKVITNHNEDEFYLSSPVVPVKETNKKEKAASHPKVEKKSTRFTRQWAKSQLEKKSLNNKTRGKCQSKSVVKLSKDGYDDIARALRAMGEGGESEGAST